MLARISALFLLVPILCESESKLQIVSALGIRSMVFGEEIRLWNISGVFILLEQREKSG